MSNLVRPTRLRLPSEIERHATWIELFFDLIFVVIITEIAGTLSHQLNYLKVFQAIALSIPVIWVWSSYTVFAARFDNDDVIHWLLTFVIMFAAIVMAIQIPLALGRGAKGFTVGFLISQICLVLLYARVIVSHEAEFSAPTSSKPIVLFYVIGFGLGTICWFIALFFKPPFIFWFWTAGMIIYLLIPWIGRKKILSKAPLNPIYIPERFGSFIIIILGQTIASVVFGLRLGHWNSISVFTSIFAFILAVIIWGQYYRFSEIADYKCTLSSGQSFIYSHIPLIISLMLMGVCFEDFIRAPSVIHLQVHIILCFAIVLYLVSFFLLQFIAMRKFQKFKVRSVVFLFGILSILFLFLLYPMPPLLTSIGVVIIFLILFAIQYWLGFEIEKRKRKGEESLSS